MDFEEVLKIYNENDKNFIVVEALKIFYEAEDESIKLRALELLHKNGRPDFD